MENKIITDKTEAEIAKEKLINLKTFLNDITTNGQAREMINNFLEEEDYNKKENIKKYILEQYNLTEDMFNKYTNALKEKAEEFLKNDKEYNRIQKELEREVNRTVKNVNKNLALKVLLPFTIYADVAQMFAVQSNLFLNSIKKDINKYLQDKNNTKFTKTFLNNLNEILKDETETNEQKIERIQSNAILQLLDLKEDNKEAFEQIAGLIQSENYNIKEKIIDEATNEQIMLLEHKVTAKTLKQNELPELEKLENAIANAIVKNRQEPEQIRKFEIISSSYFSPLDEELKFNLLKNLDEIKIDKKDFAEVYALKEYLINNKINNPITENEYKKYTNEMLKDNYYKNLFNNIKNTLSKINVYELDFNNKVKNKISEISI